MMSELDNDILNKIKAEVFKVLGKDVPEQYLNSSDNIEPSTVDNLKYREAAVTYIVLNECLILKHSLLADKRIKEHIIDYSAEFLVEYLDDCVNRSKKEIIAIHTDYIKKRIHDDFSMEVICG